MKQGIVALIVIVVIAGGVLAFKGSDNSKNSNTESASSSQNSTSTNESTSSTTGQNTEAGSTITYTNNGFSPSKITVKAGTKVTIKNDSSSSMQFDSDPHPAHTDDPELNVGVVSPGQSLNFTATEKRNIWLP